ncbi:MAG: aminotransferase IV [Saprospiraceae bacterium]|nr:aminotransferase IV [Saprospiraceae bacterium]
MFVNEQKMYQINTIMQEDSFSHLLYNGKIHQSHTWAGGEDARSSHYGDGVFETMVAKEGKILHQAAHFRRLQAALAALRIEAPQDFSSDWLQVQLDVLLRHFATPNFPWLRIKVLCWRATGGLYTPTKNKMEYLVFAKTLENRVNKDKNKVLIYSDYRLYPSPVSAFKTIGSLPYVLAGLYKQEQAADDVLLLDTQGHLAEAIASNIFWVKEGQLFTPALVTGCKAGILRDFTIAWAKQKGILLTEGLFFPEELADADAAFTCNVAGIETIRQIEEYHLGHWPLLEDLRQAALY